MHTKIYRKLGYFWPGCFETQRHLSELKHNQWITPAELKKWQLKRIQNIVKYAYENVAFYRERYRREGTQISIKLVDKIELGPSGKHHVVISDIKPDFF